MCRAAAAPTSHAGCARVYENRRPADGGIAPRAAPPPRPPARRRCAHRLEARPHVPLAQGSAAILDRVDAQEASFRSLTEAIDTSGPAGRMLMQMLGCFAEFERAMLQERTRAGLRAAREQGRNRSADDSSGKPARFERHGIRKRHADIRDGHARQLHRDLTSAPRPAPWAPEHQPDQHQPDRQRRL